MVKAREEIESKFADTTVQIYAVSVTDYERVARIVKEIGTIDVLMLNAATLIPPGATVDTTTEQMMQLYSVNVVGPLNLIKAFLSLKPTTPEVSRTIIYTSSAGAYSIVPGTAAYNATKASMSYLMRAIHEESKGSNLRTFTFHPAIAFTPMARDILGFKEDQFSWDTRKYRGLSRKGQMANSIQRTFQRTSQSGYVVRKQTFCRASSFGLTGTSTS